MESGSARKTPRPPELPERSLWCLPGCSCFNTLEGGDLASAGARRDWYGGWWYMDTSGFQASQKLSASAPVRTFNGYSPNDRDIEGHETICANPSHVNGVYTSRSEGGLGRTIVGLGSICIGNLVAVVYAITRFLAIQMAG
jgi:hypothetical protein